MGHEAQVRVPSDLANDLSSWRRGDVWTMLSCGRCSRTRYLWQREDRGKQQVCGRQSRQDRRQPVQAVHDP
jgi:hypothetical protein